MERFASSREHECEAKQTHRPKVIVILSDFCIYGFDIFRSFWEINAELPHEIAPKLCSVLLRNVALDHEITRNSSCFCNDIMYTGSNR